jgi:hypothetical protein
MYNIIIKFKENYMKKKMVKLPDLTNPEVRLMFLIGSEERPAIEEDISNFEDYLGEKFPELSKRSIVTHHNVKVKKIKIKR